MPAAKSKKTATKKPKSPSAKRGGARAGNAGKAEGDAPVRAYIASLSGWKQKVAKRFDDLVQREVPHVKRAVKWT